MSKKIKTYPRILDLTIYTKTVSAIPATVPIDFKIVRGKPVWWIHKKARKAMGITKKDEKKIYKRLGLNQKKPKNHIDGENKPYGENNGHAN
jgi:hypothetical protein